MPAKGERAATQVPDLFGSISPPKSAKEPIYFETNGLKESWVQYRSKYPSSFLITFPSSLLQNLQFPCRNEYMYPLVDKHSYWKWPFIVDLPINSMVMFHSYVSLPEGILFGYNHYPLSSHPASSPIHQLLHFPHEMATFGAKKKETLSDIPTHHFVDHCDITLSPAPFYIPVNSWKNHHFPWWNVNF